DHLSSIALAMGSGNQFMQQLSLDNIYGNRYWLYYILSLKLSNEQMEEALDELIVSRLLDLE
ncbi:hypothetical protein, partial [Escherichia coli]|uniref:hypothetical protein n=1 Tax=Escherichia coli TaxID=562 RepID=UPI0013D6AE8B